MELLKLSAHMVQSTRALTAPSATFLTTTVKMSMGNLMRKAAPAVMIPTVNDSIGAQSAKMYLMTFLTLTGLLQTSHQTPLQAQTGYYAHADGGATHVELSMRTCHPVTRMPVEIEIMVNADQG